MANLFRCGGGNPTVLFSQKINDRQNATRTQTLSYTIPAGVYKVAVSKMWGVANGFSGLDNVSPFDVSTQILDVIPGQVISVSQGATYGDGNITSILLYMSIIKL